MQPAGGGKNLEGHQDVHQCEYSCSYSSFLNACFNYISFWGTHLVSFLITQHEVQATLWQKSS